MKKKFPVGSVHSARVLGLDWSGGVAVCSLQKTLLAGVLRLGVKEEPVAEEESGRRGECGGREGAGRQQQKHEPPDHPHVPQSGDRMRITRTSVPSVNFPSLFSRFGEISPQTRKIRPCVSSQSSLSLFWKSSGLYPSETRKSSLNCSSEKLSMLRSVR